MGCGESRVKRISLTSDQDWEGTDKWEKSTDVVTKQVVQELSVSALQQPIIKEEENVKPFKNIWEGLDSRATAPNRLLDSIPTSDLGESLDCRPRRVVEVENSFQTQNIKQTTQVDQHGGSRSAPVSANSLDSGDRYLGSNQYIIEQRLNQFQWVRRIRGRICAHNH